MRMITPLLALALLAPGVCQAAPGNPLIGSWRLSSGDPGSCYSALAFSGQAGRFISPPTSVIPQGVDTTTAVSFVSASPSLVVVMTNAAGYVNYSFTDANHMYYEVGTSRCWFVRTS